MIFLDDLLYLSQEREIIRAEIIALDTESLNRLGMKILEFLLFSHEPLYLVAESVYFRLLRGSNATDAIWICSCRLEGKEILKVTCGGDICDKGLLGMFQLQLQRLILLLKCEKISVRDQSSLSDGSNNLQY